MKERKNKGYTLIELVMAMVLIAIISYIVSMLLYSGVTGYFTRLDRIKAFSQGRTAMERMVREIRTASNITNATEYQICFTNTPDGLNISYRYSGISKSIVREDNYAACPGSAGYPLATGIEQLYSAPFVNGIFAYSMINNSITQTPAPLTDIRRVMIGISAQSNVGGTNQSVVLRSDAYLRNTENQ